jgi:hypothetical protein
MNRLPSEPKFDECHSWPDGEGPLVKTGTSPNCNGGSHMDCPGIGQIDGEQIFCMCACHRKPGEC